ncbi:hypothetical protein [uncultured Sphingomonas sp.]|jgi:hypothetical protein|uniref:hypothetical protein n=1 Tax=unclassified Sphingomonas TaxID=196159 RepID=UPI0025E67557|nr:hypothetical protein [uncultured Sphingomonas sp.]
MGEKVQKVAWLCDDDLLGNWRVFPQKKGGSPYALVTANTVDDAHRCYLVHRVATLIAEGDCIFAEGVSASAMRGWQSRRDILAWWKCGVAGAVVFATNKKPRRIAPAGLIASG